MTRPIKACKIIRDRHNNTIIIFKAIARKSSANKFYDLVNNSWFVTMFILVVSLGTYVLLDSTIGDKLCYRFQTTTQKGEARQ